MSSQPPPKPWEKRRVLGPATTTSTRSSFQSSELGTNSLTRPGQPTLTRVPPPILPRPSQQTGSGSSFSSFRPTYSSFPPAYSTYGSSLYGSYSPYSYGGLGYSRFRTDDLPPSRFVQQAEESSRGAFQSIESIVHAFSSVSMMMDATFSAVYNSFRAVLDVANHFSRLKIHFTKVFSAFALVRTIRFLYRRLLLLLRLRKSSENEDLWAESAGTVARIGPEEKLGNSAKSWPIFLFFAVVLGGPYLIWKLLSTCSEEEIEQQPKIRGWLMASLGGQSTGFVPANYIKILGKRRGRKAVALERVNEEGPPALGASTAVTARAATTLEEQEAAFESAFVEMNKDPVLSSPAEENLDWTLLAKENV
uniref:Peroxin-13 n=1 Tax=Geotrypetes seraphini TaxID=260995 RepID=A0A6P8R2S7_GEOSA|nr:peroxisome biogenesis factor 13 isoform X2 [Geotrypetes seraphini]